MKTKSINIWSYALYGFLVGIIFPIIASTIKFLELNLPPTWRSLRAIHLGEPIMLIVDLVPIILSTSYALIGIQSARFQETSRQLTESRKKQTEQTEFERLFLEALINSTSFAVVWLDSNHHIITCNKAFEELFGYTKDEIIGKHLDDMISSADLRQEASRITSSVTKGNLERLISKRKRKDGSLVDVEIVGVPVTVGGERIGILGLYHDISSRIAAELALRESESRFKSLFNESPISLWEEDFSAVKEYLTGLGDKDTILDLIENDQRVLQNCIEKINILDVNQATLDLFNAKSKDELFAGLSDILMKESLDAFRNEIRALIDGKQTFDCEIMQRKMSGDVINGWLRLSLPPEYKDSWERIYLSIVDITERKLTEERMRYMSFHDALTGLYNRAYFEEELQRLNTSRQYPISIIACDLDNLKTINDKYGHEAGDRALKAAAKILGMGTFRKEDVVARTGGDEFTIILPMVDISKTPAVFQRIERGIARHNSITSDDGLYRPVSISMGYAVVKEGESLEEGYKKADAAMYAVKRARKAEVSSTT